MGREFVSAASRWCHLNIPEMPQIEIVAVADTNEQARAWFIQHVSTLKCAYKDYNELIEMDEVDAVYCALPHVLHADAYSKIIRSGKHLLGEKPFGMNQLQNQEIMEAVKSNPQVFVRCSSQYPFYPACQKVIQWVSQKKVGRIIEVRAGFNHSSDLDLDKPINWKRKIDINGEYGCLGDLGIHTQHVPFRMGFKPVSVFSQLSKIVEERPDGKGGTAKCETWDNALLMCDVSYDGYTFPMRLETKRMSPGSTDDWFIEVDGLSGSVKFSTEDPNAFWYTQSSGKEQSWTRVIIGYQPQFPTITGSIFEFGFTDAVLQMWAAYVLELSGQAIDFGCFTPEETTWSHALQTAALQSHCEKRAVDIRY